RPADAAGGGATGLASAPEGASRRTARRTPPAPSSAPSEKARSIPGRLRSKRATPNRRRRIHPPPPPRAAPPYGGGDYRPQSAYDRRSRAGIARHRAQVEGSRGRG